MNIKKTIKKMSALATGAAMLGATVMGAMAYDLGDYPYPYVDSDGAFSGYVVVGSKGSNAAGLAQDMVGAVDIGVSLQAASKSPVAVSGGSVSVAGGKEYDETAINAAWTAVTLTDTKLDGFVDDKTDFLDTDVDYHDELVLGTNSLIIESSTTAVSSAAKEDFASDLYLTVAKDLITYKVVFEDNVSFNDISSTEELEFYFLGKWLTVQSADSDGLGMTVEASSEQFLEEGDSVTIAGKKVTLVRVGSTSAIVEVDGQREVISETGGSQKFEDAGDFEVDVQSIFYIEGASDNGANLKMGDDLTQTADDGQSAEIFGEPTREQDSEWHWVIRLNESVGSQYIGLQQTIDRVDLDCDSDTERCALALGESLDFPNNYISIEFAELEEPADPVKITVSIDESGMDLDDDAGTTRTDVKGLIFETDSGNEDFTIGTAESEEVYVVDNAGTVEIWYKDGDDEVKSTATYFDVKIDDDYARIQPPADLDRTVAAADLDNFTDAWSTTFYGNGVAIDSWYYWVDVDNDYFGATDEAEAAEFKYSVHANTTTENHGTTDYDIVTEFGALVMDPESQFDGGSPFEFYMPTNQQKGTIVVKSTGTTTTEAADDSGVYQVNMIPTGLAILDSDAEDLLGEENLIVVGGPYVNAIAATLMGDPTPEQIDKMFQPGKAKIKLFADQNAILVAGYSAQDTTGAARVLATYFEADHTLSGDEVEVVVPNLDELSVREPTLPSMADDVESTVEELVDEAVDEAMDELEE